MGAGLMANRWGAAWGFAWGVSWGALVEHPEVVLPEFYIRRITGRTAQARALQAARLSRQGFTVGTSHGIRRR